MARGDSHDEASEDEDFDGEAEEEDEEDVEDEEEDEANEAASDDDDDEVPISHISQPAKPKKERKASSKEQDAPRRSTATSSSKRSAAGKSVDEDASANERAAPKRNKRSVEASDDSGDDDDAPKSTKLKSAGCSGAAIDVDGEENVAPPPANSATAPTATKKPKAASGDDAVLNVRSTIEKMALAGNKPLSAQHVVEHIGGGLDKGVATTILDGLERQGVLSAKCMGKGTMRLYWKNQGKISRLSRDDREQLSFETRDFLQKARDIETQATALEKAAAAIEARPFTSQLNAEVERAAKQTAVLEAKVSKRAGKKPVTKAQMTKACKAHNAMRAEWLKRKRAFKECVDLLADNMDKKPSAIQAEITDKQDIETDEDHKISEIPAPLPIPT